MHQHNFWHIIGGSVSRGSIVDQHSLSTVLPASLNLHNTYGLQTVSVLLFNLQECPRRFELTSR